MQEGIPTKFTALDVRELGRLVVLLQKFVRGGTDFTLFSRQCGEL